jgi:uncharacterized protein
MKYPFLKYSTILFLFITFSSLTFGQDIPARPKTNDLVFDFANFLGKNEAQQLNQTLENFALETSNQIVFVSVNSLNGLEPYEFAEGILSKWGIGQKGLDNGIVILVKPRTSKSKGQVFISTGYGLEGAIPDATAKLIVENEIIPQFKASQNYIGINNAVITLMALAKGEINSGEYQKKASQGGNRTTPILVFLFIMLILFFSKIGQAKKYGSRNNMGMWAAFWLLSSSGRSHGGSWGGFSGGSGFGGGGGFGGFGGGMGGGGGAGGSW